MCNRALQFNINPKKFSNIPYAICTLNCELTVQLVIVPAADRELVNVKVVYFAGKPLKPYVV
jgi:hypothetical protein